MSEASKYQMVALLARISTWAFTPLSMLVCYLFLQNMQLKEGQRELMIWKAESAARVKTNHDNLKLELLGIVNQTVGSQYLDIQKQLVRMQTQLETLTKNQDRRDERDERNSASVSR